MSKCAIMFAGVAMCVSCKKQMINNLGLIIACGSIVGVGCTLYVPLTSDLCLNTTPHEGRQFSTALVYDVEKGDEFKHSRASYRMHATT
eukprot:3156661-Amphidinium_carterae.1